jgi:hypothetical protein
MGLQVMYLSEASNGASQVSSLTSENAYFVSTTLESPNEQLIVPYAPSLKDVGVILCDPSLTSCRKLEPGTDYDIFGNAISLKPNAFKNGFSQGMQLIAFYPQVPVLDINEANSYTETVLLRSDGEVYTDAVVRAELALPSAAQFATIELYDANENRVDELRIAQLDQNGVTFTCKVTIRPEFFDLFDAGFYPLVRYVIEYTD